MQFAFTEEQDLLRREAREVLANGGWGRDELDELAFLDRAVVFEEAGRANRGDEFFDSAAPENEQLAALALEAAGIARCALELGVEHAKTRPTDRCLPGCVASTRRHLCRHRASTLDCVLGSVVRCRERRAGVDRRGGRQELCR